MTEIGTGTDDEAMIRTGARMHAGGQVNPKMLPNRAESGSVIDKVPNLGLGLMERIRKRLNR
jgi:hypothetical protein